MKRERWGITLPLWWRSLFHPRQAERELDDELRDHLERKTEEYVRRGMTAGEARRTAAIELGGLEQAKESCLEVRRTNWLRDLMMDLRYGLRMLAGSPGFAAIVVVTLALGIGANAAMFSLVDAILLNPLPYPHASRLVVMTEYSPGKVDDAGVPLPDYRVWSRESTVFDSTAAYFLINASNDAVVGAPSSTERARYSTVTNSLFSILGVQPALGRGFASGDEGPGSRRVFLAGDALWHSALGGDPSAIGKGFRIDGELYTLIGVMPPGFDFPAGCELWVPTGTLNVRQIVDRVSHPYHVLGRLRPGATLAEAQAQLDTIQARLAKAYPATDAGWRVRARPLLDEVIGGVRRSLLVLFGAVGFVLLIACANVINLMLARASAREREFALRAALGAGRARLLRQNLTEVFVLVAISIVAAAVLAQWGVPALVSLAAIHLPRMETFSPGARLFVFLAAIALLVTFLVGLAPALQVSRPDLREALRDGQRGGSGDQRGRRLRDGLVVCETGLALLLLCGAGLMLRSFLQLRTQNPGFRTDHLLTMKIALPGASYTKPEQMQGFLARVLGRLETIPGASGAAATTTLPLGGESNWGSFLIAGRADEDRAHAPAAEWRGISSNYFRVLGIPLVRGREFTAADAQQGNTAIVNQAMAKRYWPGADPIGAQITNDVGTNPRTIVGIVADVKSMGLAADAKPELYTVPRAFWYMGLVLLTSQEPTAAASAVRDEVAAIDSGVPVYQVATMDQLLRNSVAPQRFDLFLLGLFAGLALALAAVGIYGVISYSVSRRTHEIGMRMALGAERSQVLRLIVWQGMKLVLAGLALGALASWALARGVAALLFATNPHDPLTLIAVTLALGMVGAAACYLPARRATSIEPMTALRCE